MSYLICAYRPWNLEYFKNRPLVTKKEDLEPRLEEVNPDWVFFLDWSWKINPQIIAKYKCVQFHEADLPDFRGGSPVQNQIIRGVVDTKLTAFLMDEGLDTGDILLQEPLSLRGHIKDIFDRVTRLTDTMIDRILAGDYERRPQPKEGTFYYRRSPQESLLDLEKPIGYIYDFIRMLESPYPNAFTYVGNKKITFKSAEFGDKLTVVAEIE